MNRMHFGTIASITLLALSVSAILARSDYVLLQQEPPANQSPLLSSPADTPVLEHLHGATHLFGNTRESQKITASTPTALPKTQLKLVLSGTFTHHQREKSSALIGRNPGESKRYHTGDTLPGGAELATVHNGWVTLRRNGREEVLQFSNRKSNTNNNHRTLSYSQVNADQSRDQDDF